MSKLLKTDQKERMSSTVARRTRRLSYAEALSGEEEGLAGERSCRSCQKSQLCTRGGARFFCSLDCRKLSISAPRAGGGVMSVVVGEVVGEEEETVRFGRWAMVVVVVSSLFWREIQCRLGGVGIRIGSMVSSRCVCLSRDGRLRRLCI